ncbi:hypothetical protein K432DRAFT_398117 [Lepidopterella palustris CBS 459.81]|uniref:Uncharacterized protein n=1 Tax=Lepidopterella palustris CBS 459.81 TaxID=1314670 RepID=A0A8E2J9G8_9PEZI|nr:hypothetical protein K432DRAFT_398117 [Lepidopterella palustris CBS 459.81]
MITATTSFLYPDSAWFPMVNEVGPLIANTYILGKFSDGQSPPFAAECALFWNVYTVTSNISNGNWSETQYSGSESLWNIPWNWTDISTTNRTSYMQTNDIVMTPPFCFVNGSHIDGYWAFTILDSRDKISECTFSVAALAQLGLQNYLMNPADGILGQMLRNLTCGTCYYSTTNFAIYLTQLMEESDRENITNDIDLYMFHNLAVTATNTLRQIPRSGLSYVPGEDSGIYTMPAQGVMMDVARFRVRWGIITYPALLIAGCALFAFTVDLRYHEHIWKRSNLPLLFYGLSDQERVAAGEILDYTDVKEKAENMYVKFENTPEGYRFVSGPQA